MAQATDYQKFIDRMKRLQELAKLNKRIEDEWNDAFKKLSDFFVKFGESLEDLNHQITLINNEAVEAKLAEDAKIREKALASSKVGGETLALDFAKMIGVYGEGDDADNFSIVLFRLVWKADVINRAKLRQVFPIEVGMVERYRDDDGAIVNPDYPEEGGWRKKKEPGGWEFIKPWQEHEDE